MHATCENYFYSVIGKKPALVEELGTLGKSICKDGVSADFLRLNLISNWAHGAQGVLWWCMNEQSHLEKPPYRWSMLERELGMFDSHFITPSGLDDEAHFSTAYDMALLGAYALENELFREIIAQPEMYATDLEGKHICNVTNADRFLREYSGALGIKTGYTNKAGHCFVGAAEQEDVLLVSCVLGSGWGTGGKERKWTDTKALMNYGFETYHTHEAVKEGTIFGEVKISV